MIREHYVSGLRDLAANLGPVAIGSVWYLFGSIDRDMIDAADVDVLILCGSAEQADLLRAEIDPDALGRPLDLSLMTFAEESETGAVVRQGARQFYPRESRVVRLPAALHYEGRDVAGEGGGCGTWCPSAAGFCRNNRGRSFPRQYAVD